MISCGFIIFFIRDFPRINIHKFCQFPHNHCLLSEDILCKTIEKDEDKKINKKCQAQYLWGIYSHKLKYKSCKKGDCSKIPKVENDFAA